MCLGEIVSEKFSQPDHITTYESFDADVLRAPQFFRGGGIRRLSKG
jgi:hypothetical protein